MHAVAAPLALHIFPSFRVGGAQVRFAAIANHYGAAYRHIVFAMDGNYACGARLAPTLSIAYPEFRMAKGTWLRNARRFHRALNRMRPDVLLTYNWGSIEWVVANAAANVRHIHIEDGFGPEERDNQLPRRIWMRRLFLRHATVVLPSRSLWRIATESWRLDPKRLRYVPNGIDLTRFGRASASARPLFCSGAVPIVGTVAALRDEKNLGRLLRAFRLLERPARLVIVGDGPARASLEVLVANLGLAGQVYFTGHIVDPAPLYHAFDVFALSSDTEQMPISVLEAMAAGLPVASTDVGDVREMVASENTPFITAREDGALARVIESLLDAPEAARAIGVANRTKAERDYDQHIMFRAYAELLDGAPAAP
ncbi:MAG: glycosyltransferase [Acetobacteraceae bacterium]|nr:glycosyltransferase [Acetobacteraceae bacterium]